MLYVFADGSQTFLKTSLLFLNINLTSSKYDNPCDEKLAIRKSCTEGFSPYIQDFLTNYNINPKNVFHKI